MKYYLIEDICACCGAPVPEGTMVCPACQRGDVPIRRKAEAESDGNNCAPTTEEAQNSRNIFRFWRRWGANEQENSESRQYKYETPVNRYSNIGAESRASHPGTGSHKKRL